MRRFPVYVLIDVSGSMQGAPIQGVMEGYEIFYQALNDDAKALETAYVSVITFSSGVDQIVKLDELGNIPPRIDVHASGTTELGRALSFVSDCIDREVNPGTKEVKGDYKPMVVIMSDGEPSSDISTGLAKFKKHKFSNVICMAFGNKGTDCLKRISEIVLASDTCDKDTIKSFFQWVSASISTSSQAIDADGAAPTGGLSSLPSLPDEINVI